MNLIMGRRQNKRQEPQAVPLHQQQQQQQQQQHQQQQPQTPFNKQTPPPPPPPPPPPCADDSWELQYCKWWGWNWVKKEHSEMNKYVSLPCEGATRDNFPPMRCPVMPMKRVDKNTNRFKDFCNCLFSPNRRTAESLQRLYSTPSNSLIYESLCCGNQERGLDSYTCMELRNETRNKSNKNTPNKRSQEKICKCAQELEKKEKEKRKKYCTCKESSTSLSNCCNCKEKEPPKKGCSCKESKTAAKKACNCKESSSNLQKKCCNCKESSSNLQKKCCNCKESSSNLQKKCCNCKDSNCNLKMCCNCKETTCPKKCCCGCMEPKNVTKKCCGCREQNPPNVTNCCCCPKKSQGVANTFDCPCQTKPETKCSPCQTIQTNMCECLNIPKKCTCCCHCNCNEMKTKNQPKCRRDEADEMEDEEFTCAICKEREDDIGYLGYSPSVVDKKPKKAEKSDSSVLRRNTSQESARRNTMFSYYLPKYNQILTKNQEIVVKKGIQTPWNYPELLMSPENLIGKSEMYEEKQTNFAYTRGNYWPQPHMDTQHTCSPGCPCRWCKSPPVQCGDCPWTKEYPIKHTSAQTAPYPTIPYLDPYKNKPACPYCSVHSMCNRDPDPDEDRTQLPKTSKPKRVSKEYDDDDVVAEDPLTTWRKNPEIQKSFRPKFQSQYQPPPPPPQRTVVSDTSARRKSGESSTSSRIKRESTQYSDLTNPSTSFEEPATESRIPSSLSTASTIEAYVENRRYKSTMRPVYPMQLDATPATDSLFHLFDAYRKLRKPKKLQKLQKPLAKIPGIKNWPGNKQSKLYSSNELNPLDLPIDYSNYINNIEAKITKQLKSRLLLDVLYGVLDSTKNDIESSDEQSSNNESDDDDGILPPDEKKRYFKAIKKLLGKSSDRKVSTRTRQKRRGSPVKTHPVKKFKRIDTNTDSSEESSVDNFNNLFEKIDKITKESRSNVAKLQDAINSLSHSKAEAHHSRKNQPINSELIDKLYEIINTVADEDAIQNIFDIVSSKKADRDRARSKRTVRNLFENNDLSENWSTLSSRSLTSNDKDVYSNPKPTVSYLLDKDAAKRCVKSAKVKSKSKIPIRKAKLKLK